MATTTKKTTKAKTKTTKPKATPKKAASAKTAPAKPAKKAVIKPSKQPRQRKPVTLFGLARINKLTIAVFIVLAVAAGQLMSEATYQLGIGHLAEYKPAEGSAVLMPAVRALYDIELRWIVVGFLALSAVMPILYLSKLRDKYEHYVKDTRIQPYRWFDLGVTGALMLEVTALMSGISDITVLKLIGGVVFITAMLALVAERQNNAAGKPIWSAYITSVFSGVLPWLVIAASAVASVVYGSVRSPWYVYALYAAFAGGWILIAANEYKQYRKLGAWANYLTVERNYLVLSLLTKSAFALILIAGVR